MYDKLSKFFAFMKSTSNELQNLFLAVCAVIIHEQKRLIALCHFAPVKTSLMAWTFLN